MSGFFFLTHPASLPDELVVLCNVHLFPVHFHHRAHLLQPLLEEHGLPLEHAGAPSRRREPAGKTLLFSRAFIPSKDEGSGKTKCGQLVAGLPLFFFVYLVILEGFGMDMGLYVDFHIS